MAEIEREEQFILEANSFDFDLVEHLPFTTVYSFCAKYGNEISKGQLCSTAMIYCNDSFKLPLCLYYHPKVIAAACIYQARHYRR